MSKEPEKKPLPEGAPELPTGAKKRRTESSKQTIMRERYQVPWLRPPLGENTTEMEEVMPSVMRRLGLKGAFTMDGLVTDWASIVGDQNALYCKPGKLEYGRLTIYVVNPIWLMNLKRHSRTFFIKIKERFPDKGIKQIWFALDPDQPHPDARKKWTP